MTDLKPIASVLDISQMIDISAVRADSTDDKITETVKKAKKYNCYLVTMLPAQTKRARALLEGLSSPKLGGNVGFPSGGQTTRIKVQEALELVEMGVDEIDMVIDVAAHLSGRHIDVLNDIKAVVDASQGKQVKVILECNYLNNTQILKGCDLVIQAGANFVKTGTGWAPSGATLENIELIKNHVQDRIKIKASGGIRSLDTLLQMYQRGATRFGISMNSATKILDNAAGLPYPVMF
jgi:deoxyribose-phosphate aldolase